MPNLPEIPRKNLPRTAETTDLHAHRDNSSGGRISARDLLEPQALVDPLAGALLDGSMHTDTLAAAVSRGSMIVGNATPLWSEFVIGAASTLLTTNGTDPAWSKVALLSAFHSDTVANNPTRGDLIVANSTPAWARFAVGAANRVLRSDGLDPSWGQLVLTTDVTGVLPLANGGTSKNLTAANGGIVYSDADSLEILAATATAGQVLRSGSNAAPAWSTATYPATAGTSGNLLVSDGTNWVSTAASALASAEFLDSAFRIIGSSDGSKKLAFEVDGLTTATTRTLTPQDASYTIAGLETSNIWDASANNSALGLWNFNNARFQAVEFDAGSNGFTTFDGGAGIVGTLRWGPPASVDMYLPDATGAFLSFDSAGSQPAQGSLVFGAGVSTAMSALAIGTAGQILRVNAGATAPEWVAATTAADVARTWGTLQTFPDDKLLIVGSTTASKTLRFELDGSTANADLVLDYRSAVDRSLIWNLSGGTGGDLTMAWAGTASATMTLPTASTTLAGLGTAQTFTAANLFETGTVFSTSADDVEVPNFKGSFSGSTRNVTEFCSFEDTGSGTATGYKIRLGMNTSDLPAADLVLTFPSTGGALVTTSSSTVLLNKTLGATGGIRCSTSTATGVKFQNGNSTTQFAMLALTALTGQRNWTGINETGTMPLVGNTAVAAAGTAAENAFGKSDLTNQSAAIAATTLLNGTTGSAGVYLVTANAICRTATSLGDVDLVTFSVTYTSNGVARTITFDDAAAGVGGVLNLDNTGNSQTWTAVVHADASTDVSFAVAYTDVGVGTDGAFDIHVRCIALG